MLQPIMFIHQGPSTGLCNLRPASEDEEIDDVVDYKLNELLGKVLMIINQVIY